MDAGVKVKVNLKRVLAKVQKPTKKLQVKAFRKAELRFKEAKEKMIEDFENHVVTKEIKDGPDAANSSHTLGGYGNLYSYIGFAGSDPTEIVSTYLKTNVKIENKPKIKKFKSAVEYTFKIESVDMAMLEAMTPMPWETGRSWLRGIERGISGFSSFMYGKGGGRSGGGFQTRSPIRSGGFRNTKYMSEILKNFIKNLKVKKVTK